MKTPQKRKSENTSSISLTPVKSPEFEDSMLEMLSPMENEVIEDEGEVKFSFNVKKL